MELGTESPELQRLLPPTDIRRRRDVRALDSGRYEQARVKSLHPSAACLPSRWRDSAVLHAQLIGSGAWRAHGCIGPACRCDGVMEQVRLQAEQERSRILQRLREARAARTKPHEPRWFTLHSEVRSQTSTGQASLSQQPSCITTPAVNAAPHDISEN